MPAVPFVSPILNCSLSARVDRTSIVSPTPREPPLYSKPWYVSANALSMTLRCNLIRMEQERLLCGHVTLHMMCRCSPSLSRPTSRTRYPRDGISKT
ncbi:hypothetical protein CEK26_006643 [Fusarium fujikuroi]|uniref:Uncharacterized protein n=1 Tax=Fusarium fujikuroi TaxID=5127 RepID=A0A5Q3FQH0_FUSFU|nr:hypothetical protein CEK27_006652 [Fusarium fujikuroi]QGI79848.1 hypothetical protein CEK25_006577 [Fusarium fujikuroi]QGI93574.1 hypothetical protein CEK26_006643 [Fusarium fujikuroi]VTT60996.1 unnamed protein product [Fusarium fujikuroi]VTT63691.1 unnamed protein product [Fusarium fujikuroi]